MRLQSVVESFLEDPFSTTLPAGLQAVARDAVRSGVDMRDFADAMLTVAAKSDDLVQETLTGKRTLVFKLMFLILLCLVLRLYLYSSTSSEHSNLWMDVAFIAVSLMVSITVVNQFQKSLPKSWCLDEISQAVGPDFFAWCQLLMLDRPSSEIYKSQAFADVSQKMRLLTVLEQKDGICRYDQKKRLCLSWALGRFIDAERRLKRHFFVMPATELLLASLLGVNICGIPVVDFLGRDATMNDITTGDPGYEFQEGHAFSHSTHESIDHWQLSGGP